MDWQADLQVIESGSGQRKRPSPSVDGKAEPDVKKFAGSEIWNFDVGDSSSLLRLPTWGNSGELSVAEPGVVFEDYDTCFGVVSLNDNAQSNKPT